MKFLFKNGITALFVFAFALLGAGAMDGAILRGAETAGDALSGSVETAGDALSSRAETSDGALSSRAETAGDTPLPKLTVALEVGAIPGDEYTPGMLTVTEYDEAGTPATRSVPIELRLRGNTSRRFPKKSFRLKIVDEDGQKQNFQIAGLRADDDWILNPMYSDTSKIREALAYWLWDEMNSCGKRASSSRGKFVELSLGDGYHGLYFLQERIDRKQVDADRKLGILYKVTANRHSAEEKSKTAASDLPTEEFSVGINGETYKGFELAFSGENVTDVWRPAADYLAILEAGEASPGETQTSDDGSTPAARLSLENTIDYGLWAMLVQARDGHFKNQYIHCVPEDGGYILYRIPWDLNHTFGDLWDASSKETNYLTYQATALSPDDAFELLIASGGETELAAVQNRWSALRETALTEERLLEQARVLFSQISTAAVRDSERWPLCGMGEGNAANIRDIEDYIREILPRMDAWVAALR